MSTMLDVFAARLLFGVPGSDNALLMVGDDRLSLRRRGWIFEQWDDAILEQD